MKIKMFVDTNVGDMMIRIMAFQNDPTIEIISAEHKSIFDPNWNRIYFSVLIMYKIKST